MGVFCHILIQGVFPENNIIYDELLKIALWKNYLLE